MTRMTVITDATGKLLGAVRSETIKTQDGRALQFRPHPSHKHRELEVDEKLLHGPAGDLGKYLRAHMK
jgi:hypothetical protein